jgi:hypothetical protein
MPVQRPKLDKPVCFVRRDGEGVLWTLATLYRDGSCGFCYPERGPRPDGGIDWTQVSCDPAPDNWAAAVASLGQFGFVELRDAQAAGWMPEDWQPAEPRVGCGRASLAGSAPGAEPGAVNDRAGLGASSYNAPQRPGI